MSDLIESMKNAIISGDDSSAGKVAREIVQGGVDPRKAIQEGLSIAMMEVGDKFDKMEIFLPEVLLAADAAEAALKVLKPKILSSDLEKMKAGIVVIGTVKGDIHEIGKNIIATVLLAAGFEVHDLGRDVDPMDLIRSAREFNADIIGASALMTTTMPSQKELITYLEEMGLRDKFKVMVGGGPVRRDWAESIGSDGFGETMEEVVEVAKKLVKEHRKTA